MAKGRPAGLRLETAERLQTEFQESCLDDQLVAEHRARQVWAYVEELDLSLLYGRVRTTVNSSGRPAIDPAILMSVWLYATLEGVGSARLVDRMCTTDLAYRWLLGGVSVNYHTLADFRTEAGPMLDDLLSSSVAGLVASGIVSLETVAVDGVRVRASAGSSSFRSGERLQELYRVALETVQRLRAELQDDPGVASRRRQARRLAAAEERQRRVAEAVAAQAEIERQRREADARERRKNERKDRPRKPARASTSDGEARIMMMADGGYRPGYNIQFKTAANDAHIVGLSVTNSSSDRGQLGGALDEIKARYGVHPRRVLADSGYDSKVDIERLHTEKVELFCPLPKKAKTDPAVPRRDDGPGVIAWRQRMSCDESQAVYGRRFATERPHAQLRNQGLGSLRVRGMAKVKAVVLWHVHAFNFLQFRRAAAT